MIYNKDTERKKGEKKMTEFKIIKKMIERIADRKVEVECIGSYQTITIDYVILEFEDEKFTDTWADIDEILRNFTY